LRSLVIWLADLSAVISRVSARARAGTRALVLCCSKGMGTRECRSAFEKVRIGFERVGIQLCAILSLPGAIACDAGDPPDGFSCRPAPAPQKAPQMYVRFISAARGYRRPSLHRDNIRRKIAKTFGCHLATVLGIAMGDSVHHDAHSAARGSRMPWYGGSRPDMGGRGNASIRSIRHVRTLRQRSDATFGNFGYAAGLELEDTPANGVPLARFEHERRESSCSRRRSAMARPRSGGFESGFQPMERDDRPARHVEPAGIRTTLGRRTSRELSLPYRRHAGKAAGWPPSQLVRDMPCARRQPDGDAHRCGPRSHRSATDRDVDGACGRG
jgi:hypothetical protein